MEHFIKKKICWNGLVSKLSKKLLIILDQVGASVCILVE